MNGLNRLIGYTRSKKGQYWLDDVLDRSRDSEFIKNKAQIRFDDGKWIPLRSERVIAVVAPLHDGKRFINR
jgi:hypothetical protein